MSKQHLNNKPKGERHTKKASGEGPARARNSKPVVSAAVCDHADERDLLEGVYEQVFTLMRQKRERERERAELERRCEALQHELRAAQEREDDAKVRLLESRRAERRYQQLLTGLVETADEYRLSIEQAAEFEALSSDKAIASDQTAQRLLRLVRAPLERIEDILSSQGISTLYAEPDSVIDVRHFDVAGVIDNVERMPGTVVHSHRPAYVGRDGTVIRKGAAVVTRRAEPVPADPQTPSLEA